MLRIPSVVDVYREIGTGDGSDFVQSLFVPSLEPVVVCRFVQELKSDNVGYGRKLGRKET